MVRTARFVVACVVLLIVSASAAAQEPHQTWIKLCVGTWKATGSGGPDFQVVGKSVLDGKAVLFESVAADGTKNVGLLGWEPDKKRWSKRATALLGITTNSPTPRSRTRN